MWAIKGRVAAVTVMATAFWQHAWAAPSDVHRPASNASKDASLTAAFGIDAPDVGDDLAKNARPFAAYCDFPVLGTFTGKAKEIHLPSAQGQPSGMILHTSPGLKVTLSNYKSKEQVTLNIIGSVRGIEAQNNFQIVRASGRNLLFLNAPSGVRSIRLIVGEFAYALQRYPAPAITVPLGHGRIVDICDLLGPVP